MLSLQLVCKSCQCLSGDLELKHSYILGFLYGKRKDSVVYIAQRKKKYDARRDKKVKPLKQKTDRVSRREINEQVSRSSRVELQPTPPPHIEEEEKAEEDNNNAGEEVQVREDNEFDDDSDDEEEEEDDIDEEEDQIEEDAKEEEDDEPPIPVNSRGRPIIRPTKDGAPISEGETYRRKNWRN